MHTRIGLLVLVALFPALAAQPGDVAPKDAKIEKLWGDGVFTEGGAYDPVDDAVYFTDIGNRIMKFDVATGKTTVYREPSGKANGLDFDPTGRLVACEGAAGGNRRVTRTEKDGTVKVLADAWKGKKFNSPNDCVVSAEGVVYFTDPRYGGDEPREIDTESVYRIDPDGTVTQVVADVEKPNGVALSPDMKTLYVADNNPKGKRLLLAYPVKGDKSVGPRKVLHDFKDDRGIDGMVVDTDGNVFATAGKDKTAGVYVFGPDGKQLGFISTPETPTNCVFGGKDRKTLYVTAGKSLYRIATNRAGFQVWTGEKK